MGLESAPGPPTRIGIGSIDRNDLNGVFLPAVIDAAKAHGDNDMLAYGYTALMLNIIATGAPERIDQLIAAQPWLTAHAGEELVDSVLAFCELPVVAKRMAELPPPKPKPTGFWARLFGR